MYAIAERSSAESAIHLQSVPPPSAAIALLGAGACASSASVLGQRFAMTVCSLSAGGGARFGAALSRLDGADIGEAGLGAQASAAHAAARIGAARRGSGLCRWSATRSTSRTTSS